MKLAPGVYLRYENIAYNTHLLLTEDKLKVTQKLQHNELRLDDNDNFK